MRKKITIMVGLLAAVMAASAEPEFTPQAVNPLYLKSMPAKPWWNAQYKFRAPLLVSETIGKPRDLATVDCICDLGQKIDPNSIRILTPWDEEIPAQVMALEDNKVELIFQTDLRPYQQKPFFIYFGNPEAGKRDTDTDLVMTDKGKYLDIRNEKIQACFTTDNTRSGKIQKFRIIGTRTANQLTELNTGTTWAGLDLGTNEVSAKPAIKFDGPFKKTIEYKGQGFLLQYTVYSFSPRIDFKIIPQDAKRINTVTKWVAGGGSAYDTFSYEGLKGPMQFKAGYDAISEKPAPEETLTKYMREGWAAVSDDKLNETVGVFFDRAAMTHFKYYSSAGSGGETFYIDFSLKEPVAGALAAMRGDWQEFRSAYLDWKNPPEISLGNIQPYENIGYKVPSFLTDFTRDYKFSDGRDGERITEDFAEQMISRLRQLSANAAKVTLYRILSVPVSKEQYAAYTNLCGKKYFYSKYTKFGDYDKAMTQEGFNERYAKAMANGSYLEHVIKAAHAKGLAVRTWDYFPPFKKEVYRYDYIQDPECQAFAINFYKTMAACGIDLLHTYAANEWAYIPLGTGYTSSRQGPFWEKTDEWFATDKLFIDLARRVHTEIKKDHPNLPISTLCSCDYGLVKMQFMDEKAPYLDTVENEFGPGMIPRMPHLKYGIRRMHGIFGNDGRTIQHHFYYFEPNPLHRVSEMEVPMMFGVKSFSHESLGVNINNPELNEITADFYRLTDYTALDKFITGCIPYKFMAVFRDTAAFKDDIRKNRISHAFPTTQTEHESRCNQLMVLKNIQMDVMFERFFKASELKKYKLVFVPSDRVLKDEYVKEIEAYAKEGGCVVSEGNTVDNALFAKLAGVKKIKDEQSKIDLSGIPMEAPVSVQTTGAEILLKDLKDQPVVYVNNCGKGKVVYAPYILTDDINSSKEKELFVRNLLVKLAGTGPIIPEEAMVSLFDSSLLVNGKDYFYGVYNPSLTKTLNTMIKLDLPEAQNYQLLNVKTGERTPFDGTVKVGIAPLQTGFYVIGAEKTTTLPELKKAVLAGGCSSKPGMKFLEKSTNSFSFEFTPAGKPKMVGVLRIIEKQDPRSQVWGAEAIYNCLKENLTGVKVEYLENLKSKTINGCDAVVVPNMGPAMPNQLQAGWWEIIAEFANQGGGVMVMHHAIGLGSVGEPPFPTVGKWSGNYHATNDFVVVKEHPVTEGLKIGEVFKDQCWDYDEVEVGEDGVVLANGLTGRIPSPALAAGKFGKGNVVVSGIGIGAGYKKENDKFVKYEAAPEGGLKKILLNSVKWMLAEKSKD